MQAIDVKRDTPFTHDKPVLRETPKKHRVWRENFYIQKAKAKKHYLKGQETH